MSIQPVGWAKRSVPTVDTTNVDGWWARLKCAFAHPTQPYSAAISLKAWLRIQHHRLEPCGHRRNLAGPRDEENCALLVGAVRLDPEFRNVCRVILGRLTAIIETKLLLYLPIAAPDVVFCRAYANAVLINYVRRLAIGTKHVDHGDPAVFDHIGDARILFVGTQGLVARVRSVSGTPRLQFRPEGTLGRLHCHSQLNGPYALEGQNVGASGRHQRECRQNQKRYAPHSCFRKSRHVRDPIQVRRVGKAKRAHHLTPRSLPDGGHDASRLCPPYGSVTPPLSAAVPAAG